MTMGAGDVWRLAEPLLADLVAVPGRGQSQA